MSYRNSGKVDPPVELEAVDQQASHEGDGDFEWTLDIWLNLGALYLTYFSCVWAQAVPGSSLGFIQKAYPLEAAESPWIAGVGSLCLCVISSFIGELSDIFGRRYFLFFTACCGLAGMLISSRAESVAVIIGGQTITSVGFSVGYLTTPLVAEIVPKRSRSLVISATTFLTGVVSIGGWVGMAAVIEHDVGGHNEGWRIGFYLGAGFWALAFGLLFSYHPGKRPNPEGLSVMARLRKFDWVGIFLATASLTLILVALQSGGSTFPWRSAKFISLITVGTLTLVALCVWEAMGAKHPLVPRQLFQHRNYAIGLAINFIEGVAAFGSQSFQSPIVLNLLQPDYFKSGLYNLPSAAGTIVGALVSAIIVYKTREVKWIAIIGCALLTVSVGVMALLEPNINLAAWFLPTIVSGTCIGVFAVLNPVIATICTPNELVATSVTIGTSMRGLGGAIGIVMISTIFQNKNTTYLPEQMGVALAEAGLPVDLMPQVLGALSTGNTAALLEIPGMSTETIGSLVAANQQAYADAYRYMWYSLIPFCVLTLASACFLTSTKHQLTQEVTTVVEPRFSKGKGQHELKGKGEA
ncbi:major facilitator superfamily domain-containing protein [Aspergillus keveii]|uniref:Major facilitator superfamily domain-containing protein n=1 Tax=Aspergillus keveii TaxID=714993 RepID=A0ABR4FID9_9EURO